MSETVRVCPECDGTQIQRRTRNPFGAHDPGGRAWYCLDCRVQFDTPAERTREQHGSGGDFSDAYKALRDASPEDVGL